MAASVGTRERLHSLIDDVELLTRELLYSVTAGKDGASLESLLGDGVASATAASAPGSTVAQLIEAIIVKDKELKATMVIAEEQAANQKTIAALKAKLDKKSTAILQLQKSLKEAESSLASVMFEARKKLESIRRSEEKAISAEELIKFAHRISASGSVAAPPTWAPGDTSRRPYPTDMEMRQGFLARNWSTALGASSSDSSLGASAAALPPPTSSTESAYRSTGIDSTTVSGASSGAFWHSGGSDYPAPNAVSATYLQNMAPASGMVSKTGSRGQNKENEDVEMMSDSSSSSSSSDE